MFTCFCFCSISSLTECCGWEPWWVGQSQNRMEILSQDSPIHSGCQRLKTYLGYTIALGFTYGARVHELCLLKILLAFKVIQTMSGFEWTLSIDVKFKIPLLKTRPRPIHHLLIVISDSSDIQVWLPIVNQNTLRTRVVYRSQTWAGMETHSNFLHTRKRTCIGYYESATLVRGFILPVEHHIKIWVSARWSKCILSLVEAFN